MNINKRLIMAYHHCGGTNNIGFELNYEVIGTALIIIGLIAFPFLVYFTK